MRSMLQSVQVLGAFPVFAEEAPFRQRLCLFLPGECLRSNYAYLVLIQSEHTS